VLLKTNKLRKEALKAGEMHMGSQEVNEILNRTNKFINKKITAIINEFDSMSYNKRKQNCNEFKQEVIQGKMDVKADPHIYNIIMNN
jgi:hypothetical protein